MRHDVRKPSWKVRRAIIFLTLIFCAFWIGYLVVAGEDSRLHETIAQGLLLLAASTIGSYVFGAVFDDKNVMNAEAAQQPTITPQEYPVNYHAG
jgi:amino acid transporter